MKTSFANDVPDTVVFAREFKRAAEEGRLCPEVAREMGLTTGSIPCESCGVLHLTAHGAKSCCVAGDRQKPYRPKRQPEKFVAAIHNRAALLKAINAKRGNVSAQSWQMVNGLPPRFIYSVERERLLFVAAPSWAALRRVFGESVPGCAPLEDGRSR